MPYQTEFPDFDPADIPAFLLGWDDRSWRNEQCPSFLNPSAGLMVFVDYADAAKREFPDADRFSLHYMAPVGSGGTEWSFAQGAGRIASTNDWTEMLAMIDTATVVRHIETIAMRGLPRERWVLIQEGDAGLDDVCDGNLVIAEAFAKARGRRMACEIRWEREQAEGRDIEPGSEEEADTLLWNRAVTFWNGVYPQRHAAVPRTPDGKMDSGSTPEAEAPTPPTEKWTGSPLSDLDPEAEASAEIIAAMLADLTTVPLDRIPDVLEEAFRRYATGKLILPSDPHSPFPADRDFHAVTLLIDGEVASDALPHMVKR